jgi:hypothetical protein
MPYTMKKVTGKRNCYTIKNNKDKVFSKCATRKNALAQLRLLRAIQYNKDFVLRPQTNTKTRRRKTKKTKK